VQILGGRSHGRLIFMGPNMEGFSCHLSGAQNLELARRILKNLCTLKADLVHCVVCGFVRPVNEKAHTSP